MNPKLWLRISLERFMLTPLFLKSRVLLRSKVKAEEALHIVMPHRLNWSLTKAALGAFNRLTKRLHTVTIVVNLDEIPADFLRNAPANLTLIQISSSPLFQLYRRIFPTEQGSMFNAMALENALREEPRYQWAFFAHNDSAPLMAGWEESFFAALQGGLVAGNVRDTLRIRAAHSSGTLLNQKEFLRRSGTVWPRYRFGEMQIDVNDGVTEALHDSSKGPVPVLPNTRQEPQRASSIHPQDGLLARFANTGTHVSFDTDSLLPVFAHMGRGTPRNRGEMGPERPPVEDWVKLLNTL